MKTTIRCIPVNGDVSAFEVEEGQPKGVVHVTVIDRDADDGQSLITGALDRESAVALAGALLRAVGWTNSIDRMAECVESCNGGGEYPEFTRLADKLRKLLVDPA